LLQLPAKKAVMQALSIADCPAEPHLLPMLKVKKFWQNVPATQAWKKGRKTERRRRRR